MIRFGRCECCAALREEVLFLRSLVRPTSPPKFEALPRVTFEADAVMGGADTQTEFNEAERQRQVEIDSEKSRLLAGTY